MVGVFEVVDMVVVLGWMQEWLLVVVVVVEVYFEYLLVQVILKCVGLVVECVIVFINIDGQGVIGVVDGVQVVLGNWILMVEYGIDFLVLEVEVVCFIGVGCMVIYVGVGDWFVGFFVIVDVIWEILCVVIDELYWCNIKVVMIIGDNCFMVECVVQDLGIDIVLVDVLLGGKVDEVIKLQLQGFKVGMVGDGINDVLVFI